MTRRLVGLALAGVFGIVLLVIGERPDVRPPARIGSALPSSTPLASAIEGGDTDADADAESEIDEATHGETDKETGFLGTRVEPPSMRTEATDRIAACAGCHDDVIAEWRSSMHARSWSDPLVRLPGMADGFRRRDCLPCHAPVPVLEHRIGGRLQIAARGEARATGVDCLACHATDGGVAARASDATAACRPIERSEITTIDICFPCHDQHGTVSLEWLASESAAAGVTCQECHMPPADRAAHGGRPRRSGRSHRFACSRDPEFLARAFTLAYRVESVARAESLATAGGGDRSDRRPATDLLRITMTNTGAAHHLPTDLRHRAIDLVVTLFDETGNVIPADAGEQDLGGDSRTTRLRLRNPYREEYGLEDTRLAAGASVALAVPIPRPARRATIDIIYKLLPYLTDEEGLLVQREPVDLTP